MRNRREIWRDFMGRFEPSADPRDAVERGFYVPRPGRSLAEQLASRLEVKPAASHVLVGGVGSGKTTQLLVARDRLTATGDICAVYLDVSLKVSLDGLVSEDILSIVGLELANHLESGQVTPEVQRAISRCGGSLAGTWDAPNLLRVLGAELREIHASLSLRFPHVVILLDGLDRLSDLHRFSGVVESAVMVLRAIGIGVILVGPLASLYGIQRVTLDRLDRVWHMSAVDVQHDAEGLQFLVGMLRARDPDRLLADAAAERLAVLSGGVLRDLVALTQVAGEEAYVEGAERVDVQHVETAGDIFGRKHLVGLDSKELAVLQRVRTQGTFVQTSEKDLALLSTRRVLEYANGKPRFAVHPTIEPLLAQIAEAP